MKKYLLIDDDDIFNFLHMEVIKQVEDSPEITMYNSSVEALEYLKDLIHKKIQLPDYIFVDIRMPELSGFELLDELMKFPEELFKNSSIYFVTSSLDQRDKVKSLDYPIVKGFKEKTITTELLKDM
jgi:CheY-like chemotaxis protein